MNTVHTNNFEFYEEMNEIIQKEAIGAFPPGLVGVLASIGSKKGQTFEPDVRMRAILEDAIEVANATARTIEFAQRDPRGFNFDDRR